MKKLFFTSIFLLIGLTCLYSQPCAGSPPLHTVTPSAFSVCPGSTINVSAVTTLTNVTGLTYQWFMSTISPVGPFVAVTGGTSQNIASPSLTTTTWFMVQVTCTNTSGFISSPSVSVTVQGPVASTVPYLEDFSGISVNNQLPNCSWSATGLGSAAMTFTNPGKMAAFSYSANGSAYFFTNKIWLYTGVTYSTGLSYHADVSGQNNWNSLIILIGPSQSTTGLTQVAGTNIASTSTVAASLSNTFTPSVSGYYYIAVGGNSGSGGTSQYLYWDDLFVNVPCSLNPITVNAFASSATICSGDAVYLVATGATNYTWSTGSNVSTTTHTPNASLVYSVTGLDTTTKCSATQSIAVHVDPTPNAFAFASHAQACEGSPVTLNALGGNQYYWSFGSTFPTVVVNPSVSTVYSVIATNQYSCWAMATVQVVVWSLPAISAMASSQDVCEDGSKTITLTANGAMTYAWSSNSFYLQANPAIVSPNSNITVTVSGTDQNGCVGKTFLVLVAHPSPTVTALPVNTLVCLGKPAVFQASGALTYSWNGGATGSQMIVVPTMPSAVFYTVTGTNAEGCSSSAVVALIADACVGISAYDIRNALTVFPNPSSGKFTVEDMSRFEHAEVTDMLGRAVPFVRSGDDLLIENAPAGIYMLKLSGNDRKVVTRLVKK